MGLFRLNNIGTKRLTDANQHDLNAVESDSELHIPIDYGWDDWAWCEVKYGG